MYCSDVFDVPANRELLTYIHAELLCSAAYIWITDEHDAELPSQIVDNIKVLFNGNTRHDFTGHQSRFIVRDELPHQTLPNTKSQNLYNISYFSGRVEENGIEQGANFSRLDNYSIKFNFSQAAPPRIKIHMIHRAQNTMRVMHGMAGLVFMLESFRISFQPVERPSRPLLSDYVKPEFQNTDQLIDVQEDDKTCLITYQDFEEGDIVQQCLNCKKVMTSSHLDTWYSHPDRRKDQKCIHCRQPYNANTFRKGKVHLVPKALAVVEAAAAVDADDVALLPQEKEPVQRQGILGRLFHMFGGGADHED
jgi:hypothetical protein